MIREKACLCVLVLFLAASFSLWAAEPKTLTLREAYDLALKRSEEVAIHGEVIQEAQGRLYQALNQVLPDVRFLITRQDQDAPTAPASGADGVSSSLSRASTPQKKFVFSQPLFSGFKEFAALQGAGTEKEQRRQELRKAKETLFIDVMDAFYALAQARKDVFILQEIQRMMKKRIKELSERVRIGRSRESELRSVISDSKMIDADLEGARRVETVTHLLLEFYIGKEWSGELSDEMNFHPFLSDSLAYLTKRDQRSDTRSAEEAYRLAQKKVIIAQAGFFPTVKLDGNYYTQRVGFQSGTNWDTLLTVDVPVFKGTDTIGKVKEAVAQREEARFRWELVKRQAEMDIKNAFKIFESSLSEEKALSKAVVAARDSYTLLSQDYQHNLANNLEVLDALKRYQESMRRFNQTSKETKKNYWRLKIAIGEAGI